MQVLALLLHMPLILHVSIMLLLNCVTLDEGNLSADRAAAISNLWSRISPSDDRLFSASS